MRIKVKEYLSWLSVITIEVSLLVTVEAFAIIALAISLASIVLGVLCLLRPRSIAKVLPCRIIFALKPSWRARIIVNHIGAPSFTTLVALDTSKSSASS